MIRPVFHDPSGRRARRLGLAAGVAASLVAALVAAFFASLAIAPRMPALHLSDPHVLSALHVENIHRLKHEPRWTRLKHPTPSVPEGAKPLAVGFYVAWDERSRESLRSHVNDLDVLAPEWVALDGSAGAVAVNDDPQARAIIAAAQHRPAILPLVHNVRHDAFDGPEADALLLNPAGRAKLIEQLLALSDRRGFSGYVFDFESMSPAAQRAYPGFLAQARAALRATGREVWAAAPLADDSWPYAAAAKAADSLVLMAYDEHWLTGDAGPLASQGWFADRLSHTLARLDPAHTIVALGSYGYDWTQASAAGLGHADTVTFDEAMGLARDAGADIDFDADSLNPTFGYRDDDGHDHEVWFLDAATAFNQVRAAAPLRPRGYALWRLGSEDPGIWALLRAPYATGPDALRPIPSGANVDFDGTGEILSVTASPAPGRRSPTLDPQSGLITDERYDTLPSPYVIRRYGAHPGWVALTFDDGPDRRWTPRILDILKAKHAPATFFVIGENMQAHPGLVKREVAEGHVVGNHTFTHPNIGETPPQETAIELNATQRLFQVITGRSMRLLRPPYFGDAEPSTPSEVRPLQEAQEQGFLTVGLRIDPDDWKKPDASLITQRVLDRLADPDPEHRGQIVLLHDSGGDRRQTIKALPVLIDALRAHGYTLVSVPQLAGMAADQAMPRVENGGLQLALDRAGFGFFHGVDVALGALFLTAIALGVARLVFLAGLALTHAAVGRKPPTPAAGPAPLVSVLIPCFNEEAVVVSAIRRILTSDWPNLEVLVIDDGSRDRTAELAEAEAAGDPRVRVLKLTNGGKAAALNAGLRLTRGEIVVALDADTQFAATTIRRLARWFQDGAIGAVAGNALVGNRVNLITRWQALEYVVAQNLERRALAVLGAVTVVPGAVGAWRRAALEAVGGYPENTLAEDQDLTLAIQRAGWQVAFDPAARAYTEAPETVRALLKQRFRWSFGTLQCVWKHRAGLFSRKRPVLGWVAMPQIWLFQIVLSVAAPLVDLAVVVSLAGAVTDRLFHPTEWSPDKLIQSGLYWAVFVLVDLSAAALGLALERRAPWRDILWLPIQRFGYRQMMYYVVVRSVITAARGGLVGWGVQQRRASVVLEAR